VTAVLALAAALATSTAALALALARARRKLELVARADHELRGPAAALLLAVERMGRDPRHLGAARGLLIELERLRTGLDDLAAARTGSRAAARPVELRLDRLAAAAAAAARPLAAARGRRVSFDWRGGPGRVRADRGRVAQALANLTANAVEHGDGTVEVRGREEHGAVRVEVRDRGRGLAIAADAARDAGGRLLVERSGEETVAALELPVAER
jgi:signal transduction histidine kinase